LDVTGALKVAIPIEKFLKCLSALLF